MMFDLNCLIVDYSNQISLEIERLIKSRPSTKIMGSICQPIYQDIICRFDTYPPDVVFYNIEDHNRESDILNFLKLKCMMVFYSKTASDAVSAYNFGADDFLFLPIIGEKFSQCIDRLIHRKSATSTPNKEIFFCKASGKGKLIKIRYSDIIYIEGLNNYQVIYELKSKVIIYSSLRDIFQKLPSDSFIRIHKSVIVNVSQIDRIEGNTIVLENGSSVKIGLQYKEGFERVINYMSW